jgi:hypothetical protein
MTDLEKKAEEEFPYYGALYTVDVERVVELQRKAYIKGLEEKESDECEHLMDIHLYGPMGSLAGSACSLCHYATIHPNKVKMETTMTIKKENKKLKKFIKSMGVRWIEPKL